MLTPEQKRKLEKAPESIETYAGTMYLGGDPLGLQKKIDKWIDNYKQGKLPITGEEKVWRFKYTGALQEEEMTSKITDIQKQRIEEEAKAYAKESGFTNATESELRYAEHDYSAGAFYELGRGNKEHADLLEENNRLTKDRDHYKDMFFDYASELDNEKDFHRQTKLEVTSLQETLSSTHLLMHAIEKHNADLLDTIEKNDERIKELEFRFQALTRQFDDTVIEMERWKALSEKAKS